MGIEELLLNRAEKQGEKRGEKRGEKQGMEKMQKEDQRRFVLNLLTHTDFSDEKIAKLAEVGKEYVAQLRISLK